MPKLVIEIAELYQPSPSRYKNSNMITEIANLYSSFSLCLDLLSNTYIIHLI